MSDCNRRLFLAMAGAAAVPWPAFAAAPANPIIVNALGGLGDPNHGDDSDERMLSDRIVADARASGLTAVNVTMGYVAGDDEPYEQSVREIARWDARVRRRPEIGRAHV